MNELPFINGILEQIAYLQGRRGIILRYINFLEEQKLIDGPTFGTEVRLERLKSDKDSIDIEIDKLTDSVKFWRELLEQPPLREGQFLKDEESKAERLVSKLLYTEAAEAYKILAEIYLYSGQIEQAHSKYILASEQYIKGGELQLAAEQTFQSINIRLDAGHALRLGMKDWQQLDSLLSSEYGVHFRVRILIARARISFNFLFDNDARRFIERAYEELQHINNVTDNARLLVELVEWHSLFCMVWGEPETAVNVIENALTNLSNRVDVERIKLFQLLLVLCCEVGDWEKVDSSYSIAKEVLIRNKNEKGEAIGIFEMQWGCSLARRGSLTEAEMTFKVAIEMVERNGDAKLVHRIYENMQYMLNRNGHLAYFFKPEFGQYQKRQLDLFSLTLSSNRSYRYENYAREAIDRSDHQRAIQYLRMALVENWRQGDWLGLENTQKLLSRLWESTGQLSNSLLASIRASDEKQAESLSKLILARPSQVDLSEVFASLTEPQAAACERKVAAKALSILVDILPREAILPTLDYSISLVAAPGATQEDVHVRQNATSVLRAMVPQLRITEIERLIGFGQEMLRRDQPWLVKRELLRLLGNCFAWHGTNISMQITSTVVDTMLSVQIGEQLMHEQHTVLMNAARVADAKVRKKVVDQIEMIASPAIRASELLYLREALPDTLVKEAVQEILVSGQTRSEDTNENGKVYVKISIGGLSFRMLNRLQQVIPDPLQQSVIDTLLETIIDDYSFPVNRADAIWTLGDLPPEMLAHRADEIADYLILGATGDLSFAQAIAPHVTGTNDPFNNVKFNVGSIDDIRQSSLYGLGKVYAHVEIERQEVIEGILLSAGRSPSTIIRQAVPMALHEFEESIAVPNRLILEMIVLMRDPEPGPSSWAAATCGLLVANGGGTDDFVPYLVEQLLDLATTHQNVEARLGVATGLRRVRDSKFVSEKLRERVSTTLDALAQDVSFRVRHEVTLE